MKNNPTVEKKKSPIVRREIMRFAEEMESIMRLHDKKKGDSYKTCEINFLRRKLAEEFSEWAYPCIEDGDTEKYEVVDIANICMMLFWRAISYED